jgi:hypothetical protein
MRARWEVASVTWIRGPWWDGCWILSGLLLAAAVSILALWVAPFWLLAVPLVILQTGHTLSPIALAWSHRGFRARMLRRPWKFVAAPAAILGAATLAGYVSGWLWQTPTFDPVTLKIDVDSYWNPLFTLGMIYVYWNIYHFGKQNFGVLSIYRRKAGAYGAAQRRLDLAYSCLTAWAVMAIPTVHVAANYLRVGFLGYYPVLATYLTVAAIAMFIMLWREWCATRLCVARVILIITNGIGMGTAMFWWLGGIGIVSMNHWLVAIGLAGHASGLRRPGYFALTVIAVGIILFCALFPEVRHLDVPRQVAATAIAFRLALGIIHFLYDRWVWKFGDPQVRATIGRDLLRQREAASCDHMAPSRGS